MLQLIGSSAAIIGMIIEYIGRSQKGKSHITSTHSLVGLVAGVLALIGMLGGVSALWSFELKTYARPVYFKFAHNLVGITAFVLGKFFLQCFLFRWNLLKFNSFRYELTLFGL